MDPATIVQLVEGSLSLALQCGHATKTLDAIAAKYRYAELTVSSMVQGLDTIQLAWSQIGEWSQKCITRTVGDGEFFERLQRSLQNGLTVMDALERDLKPYQTRTLSFRQRSKAIWNETTLRGHQERISYQAVAMTCLLQAVQLNSSLARTRLIDEAEPMLRRSDESAYSIVPSRMSSRASESRFRNSLGGTSIASTEMAYRRLSFENDLFTATAYKRNYRNQLINHLFDSRQPRPLKPALSSPNWIKSTVPTTARGPLSPSNRESLQVHVQKEFANEQARQTNISTAQNLSKSYNDKALLEACRCGDTRFVGSWVEHERSFDVQHRTRKLLLVEALKDAILLGYYDVVKMLLGLRMPVNTRVWWNISGGIDGWLPLQFAIYRGDASIVELLLEAGANVSPTGSGTKPIHIASHRGSLKITSILLSAGASIDSTDIYGFEPIHLASMYEDRSAQIALFVSAGANLEALNPLAPSWQTSPLQLACLTGQLANVYALLDLGVIKDTGRHLLDAPLGIAIRQRHVDILRALLEQGADPNYASKSKAKSLFVTQSLRLGGPGMTPLSLLVKHFGDMQRNTAHDQAMLDLLLEHGADIKSKDDEGNQVLHYLCNSQSSVNLDFRNNTNEERLILTLLDQGIDINAMNYGGECPLYLAAVSCNEGLVSLLLLNGARCLSSAELFRLDKVMEGKEKGRPDLRDNIRKMMKLLYAERGKEMMVW